MVIAAFPLAKLGALLVRQISKPIANLAKERAKSHPFFRKYVCMPPAQFYNWCEMKAKIWVMHSGRPVNITVLSEQSAIELGANLLGETIIFIIAAAILTAEYARQSRKETAKESQRRFEIDLLKSRLNELYFVIERQNTQIRELTRFVYNLESRVVQKPWIPKSDKGDEKEPKPPTPPPIQLKPLPIEPISDLDSDSTETVVVPKKPIDELNVNTNNSENNKMFTSPIGLKTALVFLERNCFLL